MKKRLILLFALLMVGLFAVQAVAADVAVFVDGEAVVFADQKPYIDENDRTLVPMRAPMEALGATVSWDNETYQATIEKDGVVVVFTIGSATYTVNGEVKEMDTQAVLTGDRTCIPIRYAAEALGYEVLWDGENYTVNIITPTEPEEDVAVPEEEAVDEEVVDENAVEEGSEDACRGER